MSQRLERARERAPASDLAVAIVATVSIALPLLFYLHQHVEMLRHGYAMESLEERMVALRERQRVLEVQRLEHGSLERVERVAAASGLVAPHPSDVIVAAVGGSGPPVRAPSE